MALKFIGAAYLVYVGISLIRFAGVASDRPNPAGLAAAPLPTVFIQGFLTNVLNPKVALFFLAFLPQFIDAAAPAKALAFIALGCVFNFNSLFVNLPVAWLSAHAGRRIRTHAQAARWLTGAVGALFVLLAARLATLERN
jgi:threonine/homoserine/homoserine lactone efflux protein